MYFSWEKYHNVQQDFRVFLGVCMRMLERERERERQKQIFYFETVSLSWRRNMAFIQ